MNNLPAILTAAAGLVGAITALVALFRHAQGPSHKPPPPPPPAPQP